MNKIKFFLTALIITLMIGNVVDAKDVEPIQGFYKKTISKIEFGDNVALVRQNYPMVCFSTRLESDYPKLAWALSEYNTGVIRAAKLKREEIADLARQRYQATPEYFSAFYDSSDIFMRRADSAVVSFIDDFDDYAGGAHGMHGWIGVNFDSATGNRLVISDVCTDAEKLIGALVKRLRAEYDEQHFFNGLEEKIMELVIENKINFVIEPRGVTFIFNQYEIAPYAAGMITTTILFDEQPSLFKSKYRQAPKRFAQSLPLYHQSVIEIGGRQKTISIWREGDNCTVRFDGREIAAAISQASAATYVHTEDGKNYLYIDGFAMQDGFSAVDGECLTVFKLDGEFEMLDRLPYTLRHLRDLEGASAETEWWIITDPRGIQFDEPQSMSDMHSHIGAVNSDGTFSFG